LADPIDIGFDRYDRNARLKPALLVLFPLLLLTAVWLREVWTIATALLGVVVFCGLLSLVSRIARQRGRAVQKAIEKKLGGLPTTIALRHRDRTIDPQTKGRYHAFLRANGCRIPFTDEEALNPSAADLDYRAGVTWLLEQTRDKVRFRMLADENIDYGFRRNTLGLKTIGTSVATLCLLADVTATLSTYLTTGAIQWAGVTLAVVLSLLVLVWTMVIKLDFVIDAGWSYATRLLATCDILAETGRQPALRDGPA
jgi:hypothetical protein